ncbi:hypothetical protein ANN_07272 [Periplaneta americana]|uniref:Uncharacterized protein n=1 Tax=Periplaneta americana TaxID=6978 RepID=A0ABQ8TFW4_PERAM|nr:hypothetical protein ANN_07272 [Periplaneta americana]
MAGLCEGGNEPAGSLKAIRSREKKWKRKKVTGTNTRRPGQKEAWTDRRKAGYVREARGPPRVRAELRVLQTYYGAYKQKSFGRIPELHRAMESMGKHKLKIK